MRATPIRRSWLVAALVAVCATGPIAVTTGSAVAAPPDSEQSAIQDAVARAAADGIRQSVAVVDRTTGATVAQVDGDHQYISESIVKLFTFSYYQVQAGGQPDAALAQQLRTMIIRSDDRIESQLWNTAIVPSMAARYRLSHTSNGAKTGPHDWGWEYITATDEANFLFRMSTDPEVAGPLLDAMANVAPVGADGFDQHFGMNALTGDHGSKQGWTDVGSSDQVQIHSVGWTDRYFVAILQTSSHSDYDTMRADSTATATAVLAAEHPVVISATPDATPTDTDHPTAAAVSGSASDRPAPTASSSAAGSPSSARGASTKQPASVARSTSAPVPAVDPAAAGALSAALRAGVVDDCAAASPW